MIKMMTHRRPQSQPTAAVDELFIDYIIRFGGVPLYRRRARVRRVNSRRSPSISITERSGRGTGEQEQSGQERDEGAGPEREMERSGLERTWSDSGEEEVRRGVKRSRNGEGHSGKER